MNAELEINEDKTVQLRLVTNNGFVDLVFTDEQQLLGLVAGQHRDNARKLLAEATR